MRTSSLLGRGLRAFGVAFAILIAYVIWARPAQLRWGATAAEVAGAMPGDALALFPTFLATRAITIDASPAAIWPWLIQIGYGRAGFYGFDILENIGSPRGIRSADRIVPELQQLAVGDPLPLSAAGGLVVHDVAVNRYLVWSGRAGAYPGAFTWALSPIDAGHTRLVSRIQWSHHWSQPSMLGMDLFTEFTDHLAVRKILRGVKDRAEGRVESFAHQTFEFVVLVWALAAFVGALVLVVRGRLAHPCLLATVAGVAWLTVWYTGTPMAISTAVTVIVVALLRGDRLPLRIDTVPTAPAPLVASESP